MKTKNLFKHAINVGLTVVKKGRGKSVSFQEMDAYCEIETPIEEIDTESDVLKNMLRQFFQPQSKHPIFAVRILSNKIIQ